MVHIKGLGKVVSNPTTHKNIKHWNIWAEGYIVTGSTATAICMATNVPGVSFQDAVKHYAKHQCDQPEYFNSSYTSYYGCRLFDNEADARKSFG